MPLRRRNIEERERRKKPKGRSERKKAGNREAEEEGLPHHPIFQKTPQRYLFFSIHHSFPFCLFPVFFLLFHFSLLKELASGSLLFFFFFFFPYFIISSSFCPLSYSGQVGLDIPAAANVNIVQGKINILGRHLFRGEEEDRSWDLEGGK